MGNVNLHSKGKVWENTDISHILCYFANLELMGTKLNVNSMFISMLEVALGFMKKYILMNGDHQTDT